jgi:hypothetical protein
MVARKRVVACFDSDILLNFTKIHRKLCVTPAMALASQIGCGRLKNS